MTNLELSSSKKETRHISVLDRESSIKLTAKREKISLSHVMQILPNIISWLVKVYLKPLADIRNAIAIAIVFTMIIAFIQVAIQLSSMPVVPLFSQLQIAEGVINFAKPTRWSIQPIIIQKNNTLLVLSCLGGRNFPFDECLYKKQREKYHGKQAKVWWFKHKEIGGTRKQLAQLQIEENIIISYEKQKSDYQSYRANMVNIVFSVGLFFIYLFGMPLWYFSEKQRKLRSN